VPSSQTHRQAAIAAARDLTTAAVMYHGAVGAALGLGPTDEKALDLLRRHGSLSAGEIGAHSGLAPATVTALVDRLVDKGFAARSTDPADRRRVLVSPTGAGDARLGALLADLVGSIDDLFSRYTDGALGLVVEVLREMARVQRDATERLVTGDGATLRDVGVTGRGP
jgi:DNA-binding MarR family transcriptional regulator